MMNSTMTMTITQLQRQTTTTMLPLTTCISVIPAVWIMQYLKL
uniref:Uncharacterized protein n=1 Tax=Anguilla anguilla TaxID=7936 RepID=A0A0E9QT39_ANGAN